MENKDDLQAYSALSQTAAIFSMYLVENIEQTPNLKILSADMSYLASLDRFKALYPDKFINVGIAEQNLIGVSAGLSSEGYRCVALAQAVFITMRCFDQVRQYLSYMQNDVILVGLVSGFSLQYMGNSHYALEDVSLIRSIPGIIILSPSDAMGAVKAFEAALKINAPVYIRLAGGLGNPEIILNYDSYEIGKGNVIKEGDDITIFATGLMVKRSLKAAEILDKEGIDARVVDMHTIRPFDYEMLDGTKNSKLFVSVEEHYITGGMGSEIAEYISERSGYPNLLRLGVLNKYSEVGDHEYLLTQNRLTPECIAEDIKKRLL